MLSLSSDRWGELKHAYGSAADIPSLLKELESSPPGDDSQAEPYFSLWSSLYHQDDIYTASYASTPHLVALCHRKAKEVHWSVLQLAVQIEFARLKSWGPTIPDDLAEPYLAAVTRMPQVAVDMLSYQKNEQLTAIAATAIAVASEQLMLAEALIELDCDTIKEFLQWVKER